ncbi:hypothetical protein D3C71_2079310 [compost metagenome]
MLFLALSAISRLTLPESTTSRTPSHLVATICASVTAIAGGVSMKIISYMPLSSSSSNASLFEANISEGFGGTGPEVKISRFGMKEV